MTPNRTGTWQATSESLLGGGGRVVAARGARERRRVRRIGVLMNFGAADTEGQRSRVAVFVKTLSELGWTDGRRIP